MNRKEEKNMEKLIAAFGGLLLLVCGLATYWTYNYTFLAGAGVGLVMQLVSLVYMDE